MVVVGCRPGVEGSADAVVELEGIHGVEIRCKSLSLPLVYSAGKRDHNG